MKICALLVFGGVCLAKVSFAQELYVDPWGKMYTTDMNQSSFAWEYDYRQYFGENFAVSTGWLNEGHVKGHHRDGSTWQVWGNLPLDDGRIDVAAGVGVDYFFDTEPIVVGSPDIHGTAPIYSLTATWYATDRYFARLAINSVDPSSDIKINSFDVGIGAWIGPLPKFKTSLTTTEDKEAAPWNEINVFSGFSVENAFTGEHRYALAAEYRRTFMPYVDGTLSYFDETQLHITRRKGIATQAWARYPFLNESVSVGAGVGIYTAVGRRNPVAPGQYFTPVVAPFFSQTASYRFSDGWDARMTWNRVTGYDNADADVVLFGFGYSWR